MRLALFAACVWALGVGGVLAGETGAGAKRPVSLDQGWTGEDKQAFWFTPQGSLLVPYDWFLHLEQAGSREPFRSDAHLDRLRYLPAPTSAWNPDALPIGFAKDRQKRGSWEMLGLACAACHTSRIEREGSVVQVEGGPAMADFDTFVAELIEAMQAALRDEEKFRRFAQAVVGEAAADKAAALRTDLEAATRDLAERRQRNRPPHPYGNARVDALGNILNEVLAKDLGIPENQRPPDAPVSYPVIWDAHQHDFVQWNGSAPNAGPGPVLRNIGEVLGVFGTMEFTPRSGRPPVYKNSSADVENLKKLETLVAKLWSPLWPSAFPPVDAAKGKAGQQIYKTHCQGCHAPIRREDPNRRITAKMVRSDTVGTDPVAAQNFVSRTAKTGVLKGTQVFVNPFEKFGDTASAAAILRNAVFGVSLGKFDLGHPKLHLSLHLPSGGLAALLEKDWQALEQAVKDNEKAIATLVAGAPPQLVTPMYKARPLNGVWSSAPYLHNGSVPTLWELLQPPGKRTTDFYVGSRQFDPVAVGFRSLESEGDVKHFRFDTRVPGNSNAGHPFGTTLSDADKWRLIEYLKTL